MFSYCVHVLLLSKFQAHFCAQEAQVALTMLFEKVVSTPDANTGAKESADITAEVAPADRSTHPHYL